MVEILDLDGNLTRALLAIRDLRARCLREAWGAENLTAALAFAVWIDEHGAKTAGKLDEWARATTKGRELGQAVIDEEAGR